MPRAKKKLTPKQAAALKAHAEALRVVEKTRPATIKLAASRRSRNNRAKGHGEERRVAQLFRDAFPHLAETIKRTVQSSGGGKAEGADFRFPNLHAEIQLAAMTTPHEKLAQAERDSAGKHQIPVAIVRELRSRTSYAYLRNDRWLWLLAAAPAFGEFASVVVRVELSDFITLCVRAKLDEATDIP